MDKKYYQQNWADKAEALLFHQSWWLDAVCGSDNWDVYFLKNDAGALPFFKEKKMGFNLIRPPKLSAYLPPILAEGGTNFLEEISKNLKPYAEFSFTSPVHQLIKQPFAPFYIQNRKTYILPLNKSKDDIFKQYSSQRKRHIRKAEASLQFIENQFDVSTFIQHHQYAFSQKNTSYPYTHSLIERIVVAAQQNKAVHCIQAIYQEQIIAQIACFFDRHTMYYLLGSFDPMYKKHNAMSALMHQCIMYAHSQGLSRFDFEGSSVPGIAAFFAQFGSQESYYQICTHQPNFLWRMIKKLRT